MIVGDLSRRELGSRLAGTGLGLRFGPFNLTIRSDLTSFASLARSLYAPYPLPEAGEMTDFHVGIRRPRGMRRWLRRQASFTIDGQSPFAPYTVEHAFPALEWGINWCVATRAHHLLMLHSAGVERNGRAILFPASPGDGKSTLCTALIHSGWRLMSDEFGLVRPEDGMLLPLPRLIPLKNESIDVIRRFRPEAIIGPAFLETRKGTVAHVRPPLESIRRMHEPARPRWFVFPRWIANAPLTLEPMAKSQAFLMVATNAFNYEVLDETAFRLVADLVGSCDCYSLSYSDLDEAVAALDELSRATDV
ncbi:HprK-related kinase A [Accumulibacter sp.]|jgi:HprK-related kinase A|uniref:HprK-related kinase A n=1 Tax=Accumulibacter regalis TaxID=522306 RepID=C7RTZ7_ACCRE|nr:HprK-related kinase A [Accumulibacter sp.]MBN8496107.1 HprK-related kinase A [Accumulibacter sp.]MBO3716134.1 HprK-related kinase A [Accumulibacter sp.]